MKRAIKPWVPSRGRLGNCHLHGLDYSELVRVQEAAGYKGERQIYNLGNVGCLGISLNSRDLAWRELLHAPCCGGASSCQRITGVLTTQQHQQHKTHVRPVLCVIKAVSRRIIHSTGTSVVWVCLSVYKQRCGILEVVWTAGLELGSWSVRLP